MASASTPAFTERLFRLLGTTLARIIYRVAPHFTERLPAGGFLLLPNHLTWVDAIVLQLACPRSIRFIVFESIYNQPLLKPIFRAVGALSISPKRAKDTVKEAAALLGRGEIVCIFPEGELSRTGTLLRLKRGCELIARSAKCPVVPVWICRSRIHKRIAPAGRREKFLPRLRRVPHDDNCRLSSGLLSRQGRLPCWAIR